MAVVSKSMGDCQPSAEWRRRRLRKPSIWRGQVGRRPGWAAAATGRQAMRSPGRPPVARREHRQRFWAAIARGASSEDTGVQAGVSPAVRSRWFRECGVMPPSDFLRHSGRYLSFGEREEIAICRAYGYGVREIARSLPPRRRRPAKRARPRQVFSPARPVAPGARGAQGRIFGGRVTPRGVRWPFTAMPSVPPATHSPQPG
jgi:Helix-turn-helix domain